ncbi:hypothetical protein [Kitasatospora sp. NPDC005856]|uniref:hypothetical protein n=1 Tax=Kitasatospora sp. NPDC005856 TaxID=3154566 RepID=UPI0033C73C95
MRRALRWLVVGIATVFGAGVLVAVHVDGRLPPLPALCVDGIVGVGWLSLVALAVPPRRSSGAPVDDGDGRPERAGVPYRTDGEPRATAHWRGRHWP